MNLRIIKKNLSIIILALALSSVKSNYAQNEKPKAKEIIALSAGTGVLTFHGDVGSKSLVGAYSFIRSGYTISIEKKINKNFAVSLNALHGKIAREEKSSDNIPKLNFESKLTQIGLNGTILIIRKEEQIIIPFFSLGFSYIMFDPHGDLLDKKNQPYYYWKDGSIRDLPETGINYFYAQNIDRDYVYETKLTDASTNYSRRSFAIPLSGGIKMKLSSRLDANLGLSYNLSLTDYLDNIKKDGVDTYFYSSVSITWNIFSFTKKEKEEASQLFAEMDKADSDNDGVLDGNDLCQGTPKDVKVDSKGCPIDSDSDGVPDYIDKEPHSKNGVAVDATGVELTKARMKELSRESNITAASRKEAFNTDFNQKPSSEFMKMIEEMQKENRKNPDSKKTGNAIPNDLLIADWNKDGFIASDEIAKTIDSFFDGTITFSVEQINKLIDFFFEQ